MKKTYQQPMVIIAHVEPQSILAGTANGASVYSTSASSSDEVLSRGGDWDDE